MPPADHQKNVVLFVHGFGSSRKCWNRMIELLSADPALASRYEFATWDYPTKWVELNLLGRIPSLKELGRALGDEIDSPGYHGRRLTLVGHSQGGLVIQSYFADLLQQGQASTLARVQQVIFFATPSEGSLTGWNLRLLLSTLFQNPQELTLRVLNPDVAEMRAVIQQRAVSATSDGANSWRVPIHVFCGLQDNIVPEASARGPFVSVKRVPGNHFTILRPVDRKDPRYREFAELLLEPVGHPQRFEVESYETILRIEPRNKQTIRTTNKNPRTVEYDNYAIVRRSVRFPTGNCCRNRFAIQYRTRNEGYVVGHTSHTNEAPPQEQGRWDDDGTCFRFDFTPDAGQTYCLEVEVYGGFDAGQRDVHFHLGDQSHFRRMRYEVDLSMYVNAGYAVSEEPRLYLTPGSCKCQEFGTRRRALEPVPMASRSSGRYTWELEDVYSATVDIVWDVSKILEPEPVKVEPNRETLANG
jgi:pimeloyl-ACP methyl ester carboxylesterase